MQRAVVIEIVGKGINLAMLPARHSVFDLCESVCNEWLDGARNGDGGVEDHLWTLSKDGDGVPGPFGLTFGAKKYVGPFGMMGYDEDDVPQDRTHSTCLDDLALQAGTTLSLDYDMGSTTDIKLRCVREMMVADETAAQLPSQCTRNGDLLENPADANDNFVPHSPPPDQPTLDTVFPHLSGMLKDPRLSVVILFPNQREICAVLEAGPGAMTDLLFAPVHFSSAEEMLFACNQACDTSLSAPLEEEGIRWDAIGRMVFPAAIPDAASANKFGEFKKQVDDFEAAYKAAGGDMENLSEQHAYMAMGAKQLIIRATEKESEQAQSQRFSTGFSFSTAFPRCSAAYDSHKNGPGEYRWIRYQPYTGRLQLCQGTSTGEDRECPEGGELASLHGKHFSSLQDLFCAAEALWPTGADSHKKRKRQP
jgi:hypothetical protein